MNACLMHKHTPVAAVTIDDRTGRLTRCGTVFAEEHLPIGVTVRHGHVDRPALSRWWEDRSLPSDRAGVAESLSALGVTTVGQLRLKSFALSLSDCYWLKPDDTAVMWDEVNLYEHGFSEEVGDVLLGWRHTANELSSPDSTTDGFLRKKWSCVDGQPCLLKAGSFRYYQQPFNEAAAAAVLQALGVAHTPYTVQWHHGEPFSVCPTFSSPSCEMVPAIQIYYHAPKPNNLSVYQHYAACCRQLGICHIVPALDEMLVADFLIANEDRHFGNFGMLRDPDTLQWLRPIPLFDNGTSFGYDLPTPFLRAGRSVPCRPFKAQHTDQLRLVSDYRFIPFDRLYAVEETLRDIFARSGTLLEADRQAALVEAYHYRVDYLRHIAHAHPSLHDDPTQDTTDRSPTQYDVPPGTR